MGYKGGILALGLWVAAGGMGTSSFAQERDNRRAISLAEAVERLPKAIVLFVQENGWNEVGGRNGPTLLRETIKHRGIEKGDTASLIDVISKVRFPYQNELIRSLLHSSDLFQAPTFEESLIQWWENAPERMRLSYISDLAVEDLNPALGRKLLDRWAEKGLPLPKPHQLRGFVEAIEILRPARRLSLLERVLTSAESKNSNVPSETADQTLQLITKETGKGKTLSPTLLGSIEGAYLKRLGQTKCSFSILISAVDAANRIESETLRTRISEVLSEMPRGGLLRTVTESVAEPRLISKDAELLSEYRILSGVLLREKKLTPKRRTDFLRRKAAVETEAKARGLTLPKASLQTGQIALPEPTSEKHVATVTDIPIDLLINKWVDETKREALLRGTRTATFADFLTAHSNLLIHSSAKKGAARRAENIDTSAIKLHPALAIALSRAALRINEMQSILPFFGETRSALLYRLALFEMANTPGDSTIEADRSIRPTLQKNSDEYRSNVIQPIETLVTEIQKQNAKIAAGEEFAKELLKQSNLPVTRSSHSLTIPSDLSDFVKEMTDGTKSFDPAIGREKELNEIITILQRRTKRNVVLVGEPGVGKTAVVEELARRVVSGEVPEPLRGIHILNIDVNAMTAGTKYRGEFEQRARQLIEFAKSRPDVVLFVDEMHQVMSAGGVSTSEAPLLNALKPYLANGGLRMIGATDLVNLRHIESDPATRRRFKTVLVSEPTVAQTIEILKRQARIMENHHGVKIMAEAIVAAARLSNRYIQELKLPDKAIDLIDQASSEVRLAQKEGAEPSPLVGRQATVNRIELEARVRVLESTQKILRAIGDSRAAEWVERHHLQPSRVILRNIRSNPTSSQVAQSGVVTAEKIAELISRQTGVPVTEMGDDERSKLAHLEDELGKRVVGQRPGIIAVSNAIRRMRSGLQDPNRPPVFLFVGPTGVGKTELVKALASTLFSDERNMSRFDMSEYMEKHSVARLIGSPPGYVGHEDGGQLTESVRRKPFQVILLDEIEKAHPDVFQLFLQLFEDGRLTDGKGRTVDFKNTIVIMTSNIGSDRIRELAQKKRDIGFSATETQQASQALVRKMRDSAMSMEDGPKDAVQKAVTDAIAERFKPEFINRIDEVVQFSRLTQEDVRTITQLQINSVNRRLAERNVTIAPTEAVLDLISREGYDPLFGARPLRRLVQNWVENPLAKLFVSKKGVAGKVVIDLREDGTLEFKLGMEVLETFRPLLAKAPPPSKVERREGGGVQLNSGIDPYQVARAVKTLSPVVKEIGRAGLGYAGTKLASDVVIALIERDLAKLKSWQNWEDVRHVMAEAMSLGAAGMGGELIFKTGYQGIQRLRGITNVLEPVAAQAGIGAMSARIVPLWIALAGAPLLMGEGFQWKSALAGVPNVILSHAAAKGIVKGFRIARTALKTGESITTMLKAQSAATLNPFEMFAVGVIEFTCIYYLGELEQTFWNSYRKKELKEDLADSIASLVKSVSTETPSDKFTSKRDEAQMAFRGVVGHAATIAYQDELMAQADFHEKRNDLEKRAKGSTFRGPMTISQRQGEKHRLESAYLDRLHEIKEERKKETNGEAIHLPLPFPKEVVGSYAWNREGSYRDALEGAIDRSLEGSPAYIMKQAETAIGTVITGATQLWQSRGELPSTSLESR